MFDPMEQRLIDLAAANQVSQYQQTQRERGRMKAQVQAEEAKQKKKNRILGGAQLGLGGLLTGLSFIPTFTPFTAPMAGGMLGSGINTLTGGELPMLGGLGAMAGNAIGSSRMSLYGRDEGSVLPAGMTADDMNMMFNSDRRQSIGLSPNPGAPRSAPTSVPSYAELYTRNTAGASPVRMRPTRSIYGA